MRRRSFFLGFIIVLIPLALIAGAAWLVFRIPSVRSRKMQNPIMVRLNPRYFIRSNDATSAPRMYSMRLMPSRQGMKPSGRGSLGRR